MKPETFETLMNTRLGDGYRLRWSMEKKLWVIEQKIGRGVFEVYGHPESDSTIRLRDGYALVLEFRSDPIFKCPSCGFHLRAPEMKIAEIRCGYCELTNERQIFYTGYYPLCDRLLEKLESTHPRRAHIWRKEMDDRNKQIVKEVERRDKLNLEAILEERHNSIVGIPRSFLADHRTY